MDKKELKMTDGQIQDLGYLFIERLLELSDNKAKYINKNEEKYQTSDRDYIAIHNELLMLGRVVKKRLNIDAFPVDDCKSIIDLILDVNKSNDK